MYAQILAPPNRQKRCVFKGIMQFWWCKICWHTSVFRISKPFMDHEHRRLGLPSNEQGSGKCRNAWGTGYRQIVVVVAVASVVHPLC